MGSSFADGARRRHVDTSYGRVSVVEQGVGPNLVLLHGMPTWGVLWRDVMDGLADSFHCIAIDLPGFGRSDRPQDFDYHPAKLAEAVAEVLDGMGIEQYGLVAQDWGGPIGVGAALRQPDRLSFLVLGSTFLWPPRHGVGRVFNAVLATAPARRWMLRSPRFVETTLRIGTRRRLGRADIERYRSVMDTAESRVVLTHLPAQLSGARGWFERVEAGVASTSLHTVPTLLVWPTMDPANPASNARRIAGMFETSEIVRIKGAGHFFAEDRPDDVVGAIRSFAGRHGI